MTDRPYTDEDLRHEAAICLLALSTTPGVVDIRRWLTGAYIESRRNDDRSGPTWGDLLTEDELVEVSGKVHALAENAAHITQWAVNLGADGLQPSDAHVITLDGDGKPIARIHFAFEPGMDDEMRTDLVQGIGDAINAHL